MSGDAALRATIHGHWRDRLAYSCSVGGTHWEGLGGGKGLPGPRPVLFFAPAQAKKRVADWGPVGLPGAPRRGLDGLPRARRAIRARPWLQVVAGRGREAIESTYSALARRQGSRQRRPDPRGLMPARSGSRLNLAASAADTAGRALLANGEMTSSSPAPATQRVDAPHDLAAWTRWFAAAEIPGPAETAEALEALRANEDNVDANSLGEMISRRPADDAEGARLRVGASRPPRRSRRPRR